MIRRSNTCLIKISFWRLLIYVLTVFAAIATCISVNLILAGHWEDVIRDLNSSFFLFLLLFPLLGTVVIFVQIQYLLKLELRPLGLRVTMNLGINRFFLTWNKIGAGLSFMRYLGPIMFFFRKSPIASLSQGFFFPVPSWWVIKNKAEIAAFLEKHAPIDSRIYSAWPKTAKLIHSAAKR